MIQFMDSMESVRTYLFKIGVYLLNGPEPYEVQRFMRAPLRSRLQRFYGAPKISE
jgi:hypothetical protein